MAAPPTIEAPIQASPPVEGSRLTDDGVRIHPHVFGVFKKATLAADFRKQLVKHLKSDASAESSKASVAEYATKLTSTRAALIAELETAPISDAEAGLSHAFMAYVAELLGLAHSVSRGPGENAADGGAVVLRPGQLRAAVAFEWDDALLAAQHVTAPDAVFELASVVISAAAWRTRRAAFLCRDSRAGVDSAQASQAYRLLLQAAGLFQFVRDSCSPHLADSCVSSDCTQQAASTMLHLLLADAQSITTLRAMAKNNAPSLVASLALDTAELYAAAASTAQTVPFSRTGSKPQCYAQYKASMFRAYACCFTGLVRLKEGQAGQAVRLLEEAKQAAAGALPLAAAYNKAVPSTPAADHAEFDRDLAICVDAALTRARKENDHVYYQRPPAELPALPEPRRLAAAAPFALPAPSDAAARMAGSGVSVAAASASEAAVVDFGSSEPAAAHGMPKSAATSGPAVGAGTQSAGHAAGAAHAEPGEKASCWRWLLVVVAMPVLVVLSAVGAVIWLVLLPVKIICCPIGCLVQIMADLVEYFLKAPFRALIWASGKPWKEKKPGDVGAQKA